MNNQVLKLKTSLTDLIDKWIEETDSSEGRESLDTYVSENIAELMADAAFSVLLAQGDLTAYYKKEMMLKDQ